MTVTQLERLIRAAGEDPEEVLNHCLACGGVCTYGQVEPDPEPSSDCSCCPAPGEGERFDPVRNVEDAWQAVEDARVYSLFESQEAQS